MDAYDQMIAEQLIDQRLDPIRKDIEQIRMIVELLLLDKLTAVDPKKIKKLLGMGGRRYIPGVDREPDFTTGIVFIIQNATTEAKA